MPPPLPQAIQPAGRRVAALLIAWGAGALEGLLLARLVARALAARPDNPAIMILYMFTNPFVIPLAWLHSDMPAYGSIIEHGTLLAAVLVPLAAYVIWRALTYGATSTPGASSHAQRDQVSCEAGGAETDA